MLFFLELLEGKNIEAHYSFIICSNLLLPKCGSLFSFGLRYKWDNNEKHLKPETGLLQLRKGLKVFANLRPATVLPMVSWFEPFL